MKLFYLSENKIKRRVSLDFKCSLSDILPKITKYFPEADNSQIQKWEESGALEYKIIDGEKRYFNNAAENLMRIDAEARELKYKLEGKERAGRDYILQNHIREVLSNQSTPHTWNFMHRIYLTKECGLEDGELLSAWLPAPYENSRLQSNIKLLYSNIEAQLNLETPHANAYMQQKYNADATTKFEVKYQFTTRAEYHQLPDNFVHISIDAQNREVAEYLQERAPHCIFTKEIKLLAKQIIGNETRPYYQGRLLFEAMRTLYPWTSAREYSTITNIPQYVIREKHGDCGQITLLFVTLCRYIGIPARWQSGFMLHPGYENLHDWAEIYIENMGWIVVDASFGVQQWGKTETERYFYYGGIDAFRMVVNRDWGRELSPQKKYERSETVDFQRGEIETATKNLYFDRWHYEFKVF
ncbi:MAG: transglutaminase-like domain-containing protein [bacterium]